MDELTAKRFERFEDYVTFSDAAIAQIEGMGDSEQELLSRGIARAYGTVLRLLTRSKMVSFVPMKDLHSITLLTNDRVTFDIDAYEVRVTICQRTFQWHVMSVGLPGSLSRHMTHHLT